MAGLVASICLKGASSVTLARERGKSLDVLADQVTTAFDKPGFRRRFCSARAFNSSSAALAAACRDRFEHGPSIVAPAGLRGARSALEGPAIGQKPGAHAFRWRRAYISSQRAQRQSVALQRLSRGLQATL